MLRIKLVKSIIGQTAHNQRIVAALGLRKMQQTVEHKDTESIRGMVHKVKHMLEVETVAPVEAAAAKPKRTTKKAESSEPSEDSKE